jgi:hypothetical protein
MIFVHLCQEWAIINTSTVKLHREAMYTNHAHQDHNTRLVPDGSASVVFRL